MSHAFDTMAAAQPGTIVNGEHLLLGGIPAKNIPPAHFYKRRYTWDGDPRLIGCTIGCSFCYYRWIDTTADTIGTGKPGLRSIGDPEDAVTFLQDSKLFRPGKGKDIVMLCARSDGSMQVEALAQFLRVFHHPNLVFILHRGYFGQKQLDAWGEDQRAIYCTTLTPSGPDLAWTPIRVERQVEGLRFLLSHGVASSRISVMIGPINSHNLASTLELMRQLADMGLAFLTYRGCSVGNFGVAPNVDQLRTIGFLDGGQDEGAAPSGHDYYTMKNWLDPAIEQAVRETGNELGVRLYRHTGELYRSEFGITVAYNRNNRWRKSLGQWNKVDLKALDGYLRSLGYTPLGIEETAEGYLVHLPDGQVATEDVAMTVGAEFVSSILFDRHRIAPTLEDLEFYASNGLFAVPPALLDAAHSVVVAE